jgi:hypothetical protein
MSVDGVDLRPAQRGYKDVIESRVCFSTEFDTTSITIYRSYEAHPIPSPSSTQLQSFHDSNELATRIIRVDRKSRINLDSGSLKTDYN